MPGGEPRVMASAQPDDELITQDMRLIRNTKAPYCPARSQLATPADCCLLIGLTVSDDIGFQ